MSLSNIKKRIKLWCDLNYTTQAGLAKRLGKAKQEVYRISNGNYDECNKLVHMVAEVLECTPKWLANGEGPAPHWAAPYLIGIDMDQVLKIAQREKKRSMNNYSTTAGPDSASRVSDSAIKANDPVTTENHQLKAEVESLEHQLIETQKQLLAEREQRINQLVEQLAESENSPKTSATDKTA